MTSERPSERLWGEKDKVVLIAWMDFCKETTKSFSDTITQHLKQETGHEFTEIQTLRQLQHMWRGKLKRKIGTRINPSSGKPWPLTCEMQAEGSASIIELSDETRADIDAELRKYRGREENIGRSLHLAQREVCQSPTDEPQDKQINTQRRVESVAREHEEDQHALISRKSSARNTVEHPKSSTHVRLDASKERSIAADTNNAQDTILVSQPHKATDNGENVRSTGRQESGQDEATQSYTTHVAALEIRHRTELQNKEMEIKMLREHWWKEVEEVCQREKKLKKNEKELLAKYKHLSQALAEQLSAGRDPEEHRSFQQNQELWSQGQQIHAMKKVANFAKLTADNPAQLETRTVDYWMSEIKLELSNGTIDSVNDGPFAVPQGPESGDLWSLVQSLLPISDKSTSAEVYLSRWIAKFEQDMIIRTLALAAIREWVLMSNFPDFTSSDTRLLESVWDIVFTNNGWQNLHNLSLAAHHLLIEDTSFQNTMIPHKANQLADRLSRALATLVDDSSTENQVGVFQSWGQKQSLYQERQSRFNKLFEHALKLKCATVTTDQAFEFVVYAPGTEVKKSAAAFSFSQGSIERSRASTESSSDGLWMLASIHTYTAPVSSPRDRIGDALVQSKNFVVKDETCRGEKSLFVSTIEFDKSDDGLSHMDRSGLGNEPQFDGHQAQLSNIKNTPRRARTSAASLTLDPGAASKSARRPSPRVACEDDAIQSPQVQQERVFTSGGRSGSQGKQTAPVATGRQLRFVHEVSLEPQYPAELTCTDCGRGFPSLANFTRHRNNKQCRICQACGINLHTSAALLKHRMTEHAGKPEELPPSADQPALPNGSELGLECNNCRKPFASLATLQKHTKNKACSRCNICGVLFRRRTEMKNHKLRDHGEELLKPQATAKVPSTSNEKMKSPGKPKLICPLCHVTFREQEQFDRHSRLESCPRCLNCGRAFVNKAALISHKTGRNSCHPLCDSMKLGNMVNIGGEAQHNSTPLVSSQSTDLMACPLRQNESSALLGNAPPNIQDTAQSQLNANDRTEETDRDTESDTTASRRLPSERGTIQATYQKTNNQQLAENPSGCHSSKHQAKTSSAVDNRSGDSGHVAEQGKRGVRKAASPPHMDIAERVKKRQRRHGSLGITATLNEAPSPSTDDAHTPEQTSESILLGDKHLPSRASAGEDPLTMNHTIDSDVVSMIEISQSTASRMQDGRGFLRAPTGWGWGQAASVNRPRSNVAVVLPGRPTLDASSAQV